MTTTRWQGSAANVRQQDTLVITGTWATSDTITLTCNNVTFVTTVGTLNTTTQVATTVTQAFTGTTLTDTAASSNVAVADGGGVSIPVFADATATSSAGTVTFKGGLTTPAYLQGKPFTFTASKSSASGVITYSSAATAAASQVHASIAANFSGNAVLANNDTLVFDSGTIDMRYNLATYNSGSPVQLTAITKYKAYTGNVGLRDIDQDTSSKPYSEYRTKYFTTNNNSVTTTANLEVGPGTGSGLFAWDAGAGQVVLSIFGQGTRIDTGVPCVLFKGTHASNVINNLAGDLGVAFYGGEAATIATVITGDGPNSSASTILGSGCTLTTVTLNGGVKETNSAITTANQYGGTWTHKSGTVTTANIYGGTHYPNGSATYTTLNLYGGTFDASKGTASFAVTNTIQMYKGSKYLDPGGRSGNAVFKLNGCAPSDVTIQFPDNKTYTLS